MGKYEPGALGDFHGKCGNITIIHRGSRAYAHKNQCTYRKHEATAAQLRQQEIFSKVSHVLRPFKVAIRAGFETGDAAFSAYSQAFRANYRYAEFLDDFDFRPENLRLSAGGESFDVDVVKNREGGFDVSWTPVDGDSPLDRATVLVVVYNAKTARAETFRSEMSAGSLTVSAAGLITGAQDDIHVYAFAARDTASSDTRHFAFD